MTRTRGASAVPFELRSYVLLTKPKRWTSCQMCFLHRDRLRDFCYDPLRDATTRPANVERQIILRRCARPNVVGELDQAFGLTTDLSAFVVECNVNAWRLPVGLAHRA